MIILENDLGYFSNSFARTGWPVSGTLRDSKDDGEEQQDKPVRSLNGFQHKKNVQQKGFFFCFVKTPSLNATFV